MTTTQTAAATFAIGTCVGCGQHFRHEGRPLRTYTPCPICPGVEVPEYLGSTRMRVHYNQIKWTTGKGKVTTAECDGACRSAKSQKCSCECGGRNHGAAYEAR